MLSIGYEENDLVIRLAFKTQEQALGFINGLAELQAFSVGENVPDVANVVLWEEIEDFKFVFADAVLAMHYKAGDTQSPQPTPGSVDSSVQVVHHASDIAVF